MTMSFHGDTLLHLNRTFEMVDQPLEKYFDLIGTRPAFEPNSTMGRGYAARWAIVDGWLFLVSMTARWSDAEELTVQHLFPFAGNKVFAAWYNGPMRAFRRDRPLPDMQDPRGTKYPDVTLQIEHGRVLNSVLVEPSDDQVVNRKLAAKRATEFSESSAFRSPSINATWEEVML